MAWPVLPHGFLGAQGDQDTYRIERSLRFNPADSAYLNRTPASAGNRKTWTWSGWVKRSKTAPAGTHNIWVPQGATYDYLAFENDCLTFVVNVTPNIRTNAVYRDLSAWYHIVVVYDSPQATSSSRMRLYVNGVEVTSFQTASYPSQNADSVTNSTNTHYIGSNSTPSNIFDGYLTEINFIDGQALTPDSFGETDAITGRWKAKAFSGTYGTNGFYLKFADNSGTTSTTLGKDSSGNGNNWTPNNFSVTAGAGNDSLVDSPTNYGTDTGVGGEVRGNYATLNPLAQASSGVTLSDGNLRIATSTTNVGAYGSIGVSSGKWYFELTRLDANNIITVGFSPSGWDRLYVGNSGGGVGYHSNGAIYNNNTILQSGLPTCTTNDIIGVALNLDAGSIAFYKNNSQIGTTITGLSGEWFPAVSGQTSSTCAINFGQRPFAYTAPSGFKALCTTNLPTPTIQKPSSYMDVVTYTGNGSTQTISGLGFSPDLVWIKSRSSAGTPVLTDIVRGTGKQLFSSSSNPEGSETDQITAFNSNGFSLGANTGGTGSTNQNTTTYVAWAWDEAPIAGMDIVSYMGNGTNRTIAHNLGVAPKMIIVKDRDFGSANWCVYHTSSGAGNYLILNSTAANTASTVVWNNTAPTSSEFSLGAFVGSNANGDRHIAYLFAEIEGFSKFGSYTGNGSADGPFVWCGFRPRWVMVKKTDVVAEDWQIQDSGRSVSNPAQNNLFSNLSIAEQVGGADRNFDFLSNGFKLRGNNTGTNASGGTYIFCAFAESAFKYSRAR